MGEDNEERKIERSWKKWREEKEKRGRGRGKKEGEERKEGEMT